MMKKFYVYEHWRPDLDICFYVGKGCGRRSQSFKDRNKHHRNITKKLSSTGMCVEVRMVANGLSESDAFEIEKIRIAFWREAGVELTNKTDGGEGCSGYKHTDEAKLLIRTKVVSEETRRKLREANLRREFAPLSDDAKSRISETKKGQPVSAETKYKISRSCIGRGRGIPLSTETKAKLSISLKGKPWSDKRRRAQRLRTEGE